MNFVGKGSFLILETNPVSKKLCFYILQFYFQANYPILQYRIQFVWLLY